MVSGEDALVEVTADSSVQVEVIIQHFSLV